MKTLGKVLIGVGFVAIGVPLLFAILYNITYTLEYFTYNPNRYGNISIFLRRDLFFLLFRLGIFSHWLGAVVEFNNNSVSFLWNFLFSIFTQCFYYFWLYYFDKPKPKDSNKKLFQYAGHYRYCSQHISCAQIFWSV